MNHVLHWGGKKSLKENYPLLIYPNLAFVFHLKFHYTYAVTRQKSMYNLFKALQYIGLKHFYNLTNTLKVYIIINVIYF